MSSFYARGMSSFYARDINHSLADLSARQSKPYRTCRECGHDIVGVKTTHQQMWCRECAHEKAKARQRRRKKLRTAQREVTP